jgi:hypothetical protein
MGGRRPQSAVQTNRRPESRRPNRQCAIGIGFQTALEHGDIQQRDRFMLARIFRPAKSAMQSGMAKTRDWILEFEPASARKVDPLMGWTSSTDMDGQVRLAFETREEAVAYAQAHGIPFQVFEPQERKKIIKAYADNFAPGRRQPWTH